MSESAKSTHGLRAFFSVLRKEWQDAWADRRGMQSALLYALLGPMLLYAVLSSMIAYARSDQAYDVAIVGQSAWPSLGTQLATPRLAWQELDEKAAVTALEARKLAAILIADPESSDRLQRGMTVNFSIVHRSDKESIAAVQLLRRKLDSLAQQLTRTRLLARGVAPQIASPLKVNVQSMDTNGAAVQTLGMLAMVLLLAAFFTSMNVAIDCTAGERERESLEVLLSQPAGYFTVVLGKYVVVVGFALIGTVLTLCLARLLLGQLALYELPMQLALSSGAWLIVGLLTIPFAILMSALQMAFALFAKNYKEAQIYVTLLAFVPTLLSLPLAEKVPAHWPVPVLGEHRAMQAVLRGEYVGWFPDFALQCLVAVVLSALALRFCATFLAQERMLRSA
ncbi:MAG: ABC transporter permease [Rhodanobacteraceae bacterium]|nr:ABC transporter permease [Rhodanobacteraceae bacterium]